MGAGASETIRSHADRTQSGTAENVYKIGFLNRTVAGLNLFVAGKPGVGKTTTMAPIVERLQSSLRLAGFTTTEVRNSAGECVGFDIVTVDGRRGQLARLGFKSRFRVGRYGVNFEELEELTLPELARRNVDLIVIDKIGKMECSSGRFRRAVEGALDSPVNVLATLRWG